MLIASDGNFIIPSERSTYNVAFIKVYKRVKSGSKFYIKFFCFYAIQCPRFITTLGLEIVFCYLRNSEAFGHTCCVFSLEL